MIRVRYQGANELSPGLHATAERDGRRTTVYLLDGMTAAQRRSALRRLRLTARMGHCPRLPAAQLAFALFTDRIRTGIGRTGAVLRLHPAGSTVPIMVLSGGAIAFLLFSTVSIHVLHPRSAGQSVAGPSPVASASPIATSAGLPDQAAGQGGPGAAGSAADPGGTGATSAPGGVAGAGGGSDPRQLTQPGRGSSGRTPVLAAGGSGSGGTSAGSGGSGSGAGSGSSSGSGGTSGKSTSGGGTTDSGGSNPRQVTPQQSTPATAAPAPASTATATTPAQSGSGSSSGSQSNGVCLNVGPLGVCLNI